MAPARIIPWPLTLAPFDAQSEKAVPAIIVTPSSPTSAQDYAIHFLPLPPKPARRPWLAALVLHRFRRPAQPIQLPTSAHDVTSFPIDSLAVPSKTRTRSSTRACNRVLALLAIPLLIVLIHILVALAVDADASVPTPAVFFDSVSRVFGGIAHAHARDEAPVAAVADLPGLD